MRGIGKITLNEKLFTKKDKLTNKEWEKLQEHPNAGVGLLMNINFLSEVVPYVYYQKERYDGSGKPEGLKGLSIPFVHSVRLKDYSPCRRLLRPDAG